MRLLIRRPALARLPPGLIALTVFLWACFSAVHPGFGGARNFAEGSRHRLNATQFFSSLNGQNSGVALLSGAVAGKRVAQDPSQNEKGVEAGKISEEAERLTSEGSAQSIRAAIEKYQLALEIYKVTNDRLKEGAILNRIGYAYSLLEDQQRALEFYNKALPIQKEVGDRVGEARTLNNIGRVYDALGNKQKALEYYQQVLPISRSLGERRLEAIILNNIGFVYSSTNDRQGALRYYSLALPIFRELNERNLEGNTLNNIARVHDALGEKQEALNYFNQALAIFRELDNRAMAATTLNNIGVLYWSLGENQKALHYYNQALPVLHALGDRSGEARALHNIASVYDVFGEKEKALANYNQALPLWKAVGDKNGEASTLNNIGLVYWSLGQNQRALEYYNQALPLRQALGDRSGEGTTLNNIASIYDTIGERQKALEYYQRSLQIRRAIGDRLGEANTLSNIGFLYDELSDERKARESFEQALTICRSVGNHGGEATALNNIGHTYDKSGEVQKALEYFNQVLPIVRQVGDRSLEATALNNIGFAYQELGQKQPAIAFYEQALAIYRASGDRRGEGNTLNNIGVAYGELAQREKALQSYNEALSILRAAGDRQMEATTLSNLEWLWKDTDPRLAIFFGKQSVNLYQQLRANISGLEKGLQATFLRSVEGAYRVLADLLISQARLPEAQQVLGLLKEEEYFEFVRRDENEASSLSGRAVLNAEEASLEQRYREIANRVTAVGAEYGQLRDKQSRTNDEDRQLTKLEADLTVANQAFQKFLDELDKTFSGSVAGVERTFQLRESQGLMETLRELGPGSVALYTVVGEDKYRVILVTAEVQKAYTTNIKAADLNRRVLEFREAIQNPRIDPRPLGQELFRMLIGAELANDLEQARAQTLMWSLDGALRYLPVAALFDGDKYLVERYRNVVFTPASQSRLKDAVGRKWKALGFGVSKGQPGFNPLPGVTEELRGIIREETALTPNREIGVLGGKVMLDEAFTANAMQTALRQHYPLVHIASHFSFRPGNETDSFLLLGDGSHLTLAQIKSLPNLFSGVDLLTLSACDTATGGAGATGKEVEGFAVLAQRQGAKAVMATLWPVSDESTQLLMREFYRLREANPEWTKVEALRQAQLELLTGKATPIAASVKDKRALIVSSANSNAPANQPHFVSDPKAPYAHPYYWAPFILIGNWK